MQPNNNQAPTVDVSFARQVIAEGLFTQENMAALPADLQGIVRQFYSHFEAANTAFENLPLEVEAVWGNPQYPVEYRRTKAEEAKQAAFAKVEAELDAAAEQLETARQRVKKVLTPPLLGSAELHELKMLNAREEVKTSLEHVPTGQQARRLTDLFYEAHEEDSQSPVAYFIAATTAYKRLLSDPLTRLAFEAEQADMLKQLLPPNAQPYMQAQPVLEELEGVLEAARAVRHLSGKDNGIKTHNPRF